MAIPLQVPHNAPHVDLFKRYTTLLAGGWQADLSQAAAVTRLQSLANALMSDLHNPPKGLWLHGPPGRGKSRLLDLFMEALPIQTKRRVHFHQFMDEMHRRLHGMEPQPGVDYIARLAHDVSQQATVLGFDEFYLTNLPDAMLLGRLMQALFKRGTVVVATSNWALPDLFQGGLHRDRFMPLLRTLQTHLDPINLAEGIDYRHLQSSHNNQYILTTPGESAEGQLSVLFEEFAQGPDVPAPSFLTARRVRGNALWCTFPELCEKALGRTEYQQLAKMYDTVVIEGVPPLTPREADAALRLATLVDILYENRSRLVISSTVGPSHICESGPAAEVFRRTASRLSEMTGANNT